MSRVKDKISIFTVLFQGISFFSFISEYVLQ